MSGPGRTVSLLFILLALLAGATLATAQVKDIKSFRREMTVERSAAALRITTGFPEVFTKRLRQRLASGFKSLLIVDVLLEDRKRRVPVAQGVVQYTVLYDIWEERFFVRKEGLTGRKDLKLRSMNELVESCGKLEGLPLALVMDTPGASDYRLQVRITVNPVSKELRRKVDAYLSNPNGKSLKENRSSFFGPIVRRFVSEKDLLQADAVYTYRSPDFKLPAD